MKEETMGNNKRCANCSNGIAMVAAQLRLTRALIRLEIAMEALEDYAAGEGTPARARFALDDIEALKGSE